MSCYNSAKSLKTPNKFLKTPKLKERVKTVPQTIEQNLHSKDKNHSSSFIAEE